MAAGTYIHTSGPDRGMVFDGLVPGSSTQQFAAESRELGERVRRALEAQNEGDIFDRYVVHHRELRKLPR